MPRITTTFARRAVLFIILGALVGTNARRSLAADAPPIVLVPQPASLTATGSAPFEVTASTRIVASSEQNAKDAATFLATWLRQDTGIPVKVMVVARNSSTLRFPGAIGVTETEGRGLGAEGYALAVSARNITLGAPSGAGLFYGAETIRQLLQKQSGARPNHWSIPAVSIRDQPRYPERSLMIDSARHYQSMAFLKRTLDLLAYHKMNTMHWHISDDQGWRLEIKRYPKLTEVGAYRKDGAGIYGSFYTQDQVRDLVAYAAARHITIVPELDMPAHCISLLAAYPENACFPRAFKVSTAGISNDTPGSPDVLCAGREETYTFMEDILTEVMALFPSRAIHIGGDECPTVRWKACPVCQARIKSEGLKDERALQNYFTNRIAAFLTAHGRRLQGWNEILEGGTLPKDVIVQPWNRPESAAAAARAGNEVVVSSTRYGYFDYGYNSISLRRVYEWNPTPPGLDSVEANRIQGLEACLWTEGKKDDAAADYYIWPRTLAIAEDGWSPLALRNWDDFKKRLETVHYSRLAAMGLGNPAMTDPAAIEAALVARSGFDAAAKLGEWVPSQMTETLTNLEWSLDSFLKGPGKYSVRFDYTDGACGIDIASVELVRNDSEVVSTDTHDAFAGGNSHDQTYTVTLPTVDPASKYALRVRLRSDGGTDSRGSLYLTVPTRKVAPTPSPRPVFAARADSFDLKDGKFVLNGKPFVIISGEMHYERIPREYWRHRLRMARAMGLNTIATYVFWNMQEPEKGKFDFSGNADLAAFVRIAQEEGLYVLLRTGPYACAEWEFGGYPYWLLNETTDGKPLAVRSTDPNFLRYSARFIDQVGKQCAPLQAGRGGNILMVQVENEYGSYGDDHAYMEDIHHDLLDAGFTQAQLYTADGADELTRGSLPELPAVINFGTGEAKSEFAKLHQLRPEGPFMSGEYWAGWFDHWGSPHETRSPKQEADEISWMLKQGYSLSLYMFHGGTSFGFMNGANADGANSDGKNYQPDVTSYDYDAPLDESGRTTPKYDLLRATIAQATGHQPPAIPAVAPAQTIAPFKLPRAISLWQTLPAPVHSAQPLTMEQLNQNYGYVLYRATLHGPIQGELNLGKLHDYAKVYLDGRLLGDLDRRFDQHTLPLDIPEGATRLDILVENTGRVNYGKAIPGERVGLLTGVTLAGKPITGWDNYPLPFNAPEKLAFTSAPCSGPCLYRGAFQTSSQSPAQPDTFLDTSMFKKGQVWVNGHNLGRIWIVGPQKALYLPGPWLHPGINDVVVLDLEGQPGATLWGRDHPLLDSPVLKPPTAQ